jgi:hypothetical protein
VVGRPGRRALALKLIPGDVRRYPFLSERLLADLRVIDGYPVLRHGFESSVPSLHFLGAPAARSFGPIMRFVSGSWYGGTRLAHAVVGERHGGTGRKRPLALAPPPRR